VRSPPLQTRRVLVIDDQPEIHADYKKILCPSPAGAALGAAKARLFGGAASEAAAAPPRYAIECALQGEDGARAAARAFALGEPFHVAFVDMRMPPGWNGLETIQALWEADRNLQVVLCTAYSDEALDKVTATLGHPEKLLVLKKPFEPIEVQQIAAALSEKWRAEREAELKLEDLERLVQERTREVERAALHDKLTDLPNRVLVLERLTSCLEAAHRDGSRRFALLFLDIDGFKSVNDALGHSAGDLLLACVADRIRGVLRGRDLIAPATTPARLGGDEFLVLLEGLVRASDAARVAERLLAELGAPYEIGAQIVNVSVSIGVATSERSYASAAQMLREADVAMYRAKSSGRARYVMFDEEMHREVAQRLALEAALREAVAQDSLALHYQPIVRLGDGFIEGFEALVRWRQPGIGSIGASELIAAAEDIGLIQQLGLQLLRRACRQLASWHAAFPAARDLRISVNLSRRQLVDSEFSSRVAETVRESGVDATKLGLEITETSVLHDLDGAVAVLRRLRGLGAEIVLDDFGSGYSAIAHLHRMPLAAMKIDRGFLARACGEPRHAATLEAVVAIARAFALDIVAEGIETSEQLALVRSLGVERGQGFLYSPAVPADEVAAMLRSGRVLAPKM
jgi:diguanylate cyclase (GGDEF)-like protein